MLFGVPDILKQITVLRDAARIGVHGSLQGAQVAQTCDAALVCLYELERLQGRPDLAQPAAARMPTAAEAVPIGEEEIFPASAKLTNVRLIGTDQQAVDIMALVAGAGARFMTAEELVKALRENGIFGPATSEPDPTDDGGPSAA